MTNLKNRRENAGFSQSQLAAKSGVNVRTLQEYEQGKKSVDRARIETLCDIAIALNCNVADVIEGNELAEKIEKASRY